MIGKAAAAVKEEFIMRGLLLSGLVMALGGRRTLAVLLSALAFGCIHLSNPGATALSVFRDSSMPAVLPAGDAAAPAPASSPAP